MVEEAVLARRTVLGWLSASAALRATAGVGACQQLPSIHDMRVSRDTGCPCCHVWTELMQATGRFRATMVDAPDLPAFKPRLGVPAGPGSCHTAVVGAYVLEGHVPAEDILRSLNNDLLISAGLRFQACRQAGQAWSSPTERWMRTLSSRSTWGDG